MKTKHRFNVFLLADPCRFPNVCLGGSCISFPENGSFACQCLPDSCSSENAICDTSKITMLTCKCPTNQYGPQCQYTCPCQNGGRCIMQNDNTTIICSCDESRFYGDRCEFVSPCASQPCYMGGTCVRNATKFLCQCPPNRIGSQCEKSDPCQSNPCLGYVDASALILFSDPTIIRIILQPIDVNLFLQEIVHAID